MQQHNVLEPSPIGNDFSNFLLSPRAKLWHWKAAYCVKVNFLITRHPVQVNKVCYKYNERSVSALNVPWGVLASNVHYLQVIQWIFLHITHKYSRWNLEGAHNLLLQIELLHRCSDRHKQRVANFAMLIVVQLGRYSSPTKLQLCWDQKCAAALSLSATTALSESEARANISAGAAFLYTDTWLAKSPLKRKELKMCQIYFICQGQICQSANQRYMLIVFSWVVHFGSRHWHNSCALIQKWAFGVD